MMRKLILLLLTLVTCAGFAQQQSWTPQQLETANTAKASAYLTGLEKEVILYINLARLYPKQFAEIELGNYFGTDKYGDYLKNSAYRESLLKELKKRAAVGALKPSETLYKNAKCFAIEQGNSGLIGHTRKNCKDENYAECCSYGMETGKDIALQLLIDHDVQSLGHRQICLDGKYTEIGPSFQPHKKWDYCTVIEYQ